ncbi:MAG: hypothetical protein GY920_11435 [Aliivibrio sp.]|nr:hypothetical protein [Aliivibrio sp.]
MVFVAFDIDGTLAERPFDPGNIKAMRPRGETIRTLRGLSKAGIKIIVVTARPEMYRSDTEWWLRRHAIPYHTLKMRGNSDNRPDPDLRFEQASGAKVLFDDKPENCAAFDGFCVRV